MEWLPIDEKNLPNKRRGSTSKLEYGYGELSGNLGDSMEKVLAK